MKERSIEQKANAYDKAIEKAKSWYIDAQIDFKKSLETLFPELKEDEDEKTKRILHSISNKISFHLRDIFTEEEFQCFDAWSNAWLEKQGQIKESVTCPICGWEIEKQGEHKSDDVDNKFIRMRETKPWKTANRIAGTIKETNRVKHMETEIMIRPFPSTRKEKGFYAYIHYDKWTKQVTCEGRTKEEAYSKAIKYCNKNNIEL